MVHIRLLATLVLEVAVDNGLNAILFSVPIGLEDVVLEIVVEHILVRRLIFDIVQNSVHLHTCQNTLF